MQATDDNSLLKDLLLETISKLEATRTELQVRGRSPLAQCGMQSLAVCLSVCDCRGASRPFQEDSWGQAVE